MTHNDATFGSAREHVNTTYGAFIEGGEVSLMTIVHDASWTSVCLKAIQSTAQALGYNAEDVTFVNIESCSDTLDARQLFELVEGLDPICVCVSGDTAVELFCMAYHMPARLFGRITALGRPVCLIGALPVLLNTDAGKQKAWSLLKQLPAKP